MPKWNDEMLQHLTQDQASEVAEDLRSLFANHPDIEVKVSESAIPNTEERTFTIRYSVALWYDNMLVAVFNRPNDLDRFLAVARMMAITEQEKNILKDVFPEKYTDGPLQFRVN